MEEKTFDAKPSDENCKTHTPILLSLGQKSGNIFVSDQTPTPTRLINNCEEVGLFDDLQNVNPFDETFRRAIEQKSTCETNPSSTTSVQQVEHEEELHTPQVFPLVESQADMICKPLESPINAPVIDDLLNDVSGYKSSTASRQNSNNSITTPVGFGKLQKHRSIAEKPNPSHIHPIDSGNENVSTIHMLQPQMIALTFPLNNEVFYSNTKSNCVSTAIPIQTVKPFLLPKVTPKVIQPTHASLTPTSQLPIKERLKAILNHSGKSYSLVSQKENKKSKQTKDDCHERRRAASTRYRNKIRNEFKQLRQRNSELQIENDKLRSRIHQLEENVLKLQKNVMQQFSNSSNQPLPMQIQIPSSTVHLVMNIPKVVVPFNGLPVLQAPLTYSVEKK